MLECFADGEAEVAAFFQAELNGGEGQQVMLYFVGCWRLTARDQKSLGSLFNEPSYFGWEKEVLDEEATKEWLDGSFFKERDPSFDGLGQC